MQIWQQLNTIRVQFVRDAIHNKRRRHIATAHARGIKQCRYVYVAASSTWGTTQCPSVCVCGVCSVRVEYSWCRVGDGGYVCMGSLCCFSCLMHT